MIGRIVPVVLVTLTSITGAGAQSMVLGPAKPLVMPVPLAAPLQRVAKPWVEPEEETYGEPPNKSTATVGVLNPRNKDDVRFCRAYAAKIARAKTTEQFVEVYDPPTENSCINAGLYDEGKW